MRRVATVGGLRAQSQDVAVATVPGLPVCVAALEARLADHSRTISSLMSSDGLATWVGSLTRLEWRAAGCGRRDQQGHPRRLAAVVESPGMLVSLVPKSGVHAATLQDANFYEVDRKQGTAAQVRKGTLPRYLGSDSHDCFGIHKDLACKQSLNSAHHLRELEGLDETTGQAWASEMATLLRQVKFEGLTEARRRQVHRRYHARVAYARHTNLYTIDLIAQSRRGYLKSSPARNLLRRLADDRNIVHRYSAVLALPFDIFRVWRDLRMAEVKRKVGGSFRTELRAKDCAIWRRNCVTGGICSNRALAIILDCLAPSRTLGQLESAEIEE